MATASLFLHPLDERWSLSVEDLADRLHSLGFIANEIKDSSNRFYIGKQFLNQVIFLGCSPSIQFIDEHGDGKFCFITIHCYSQARLMVSAKQARPPQCPACKKVIKEWNIVDVEQAWCCPHCATASPVNAYNWKHSAGCAQIFIEVTDVFPKEAIPQPTFLQQLQDQTGTSWGYFYYGE